MARGVQARAGEGRTGAEDAKLRAIPLDAVVLELEVEDPFARADADGILALVEVGEDEARLAQRRRGGLLELLGRIGRAGRQAPVERGGGGDGRSGARRGRGWEWGGLEECGAHVKPKKIEFSFLAEVEAVYGSPPESSIRRSFSSWAVKLPMAGTAGPSAVGMVMTKPLE